MLRELPRLEHLSLLNSALSGMGTGRAWREFLQAVRDSPRLETLELGHVTGVPRSQLQELRAEAAHPAVGVTVSFAGCDSG